MSSNALKSSVGKPDMIQTRRNLCRQLFKLDKHRYFSPLKLTPLRAILDGLMTGALIVK